MAGVVAVPTLAELRALGAAVGLDAVGVAEVAVFEGTRRDLHDRRARGLHGGMSFTYRNPDRSTDPQRALPGARSLVVGARRYLGDDEAAPAGIAAGKVARYARRDHYAELREGLSAIAARLGHDGWRTRVLADDNALVDREAARRAGIGWYGKNANLLLPGEGSWFVLGSVLTTAPLAVSEERVADGCGACSRCMDSCPTGAIVAPGVVDARRCLAWLLQAEGPFPAEWRAALGDRIYGCDDCQEVCPVNRRSARAGVDERDRPWVPLLALLDPDDDAVLALAGRWYIPRREVRYVRRNALVVLGNVGDPDAAEVIEALRAYLAHPDPLLRSHAVWAARRLGRDDLLGALEHEEHQLVRAELSGHVQPRQALRAVP